MSKQTTAKAIGQHEVHRPSQTLSSVLTLMSSNIVVDDCAMGDPPRATSEN